MANPQTNVHSNSGTRKMSEQITSEAKDFIQDKLGDKIGRENIDAAYGFLQSAGDVCLRGMKQTATYARRHPVRVAVGVIALGFLGGLMVKSRGQSKDTLH